jgi:hypothetical protein
VTGVVVCVLAVFAVPSAAIAKGSASKSASATDMNTLSSISCTSSTSCIAVGNFGGVSSTGRIANYGTLADQWNGSTWSILNTPNVAMQGFNVGYSSSFDSISCPSSSSCVAVGSSGPTNLGIPVALAEIWNGSTWSIQSTPDPGDGGTLSGVSCASDTACVAVGSFGHTPQPFAETWNGTSWSLETVPSPSGATYAYLSDVSCSSPTECIAVGSYGNGSVDSYAFAEAWDGTTWSVQSTPNPSGDNAFSSVSCSSADWCVAVGGQLTETWDGSTWSVESISDPSGGTDSGVYGVSCVSSNSCTAVGGYTNSSGESLTLAETWDGNTWSIQSTPSPDHGSSGSLNEVSCVAADSCVAAGDYYSTKAANYTSLGEASDGSTWSLYVAPVVLPVTLAPDVGPPEKTIDVSGFGMSPDAKVKVTYQTGTQPYHKVTLCSAVADSDGAYSCKGKTPNAATAGSHGAHTVRAASGDSLFWLTSFTLN